MSGNQSDPFNNVLGWSHGIFCICIVNVLQTKLKCVPDISLESSQPTEVHYVDFLGIHCLCELPLSRPKLFARKCLAGLQDMKYLERYFFYVQAVQSSALELMDLTRVEDNNNDKNNTQKVSE